MAALLVLSAIIWLILIFHRQKYEWREAILLASLVWGSFITVTTELLSLMQQVTFPGIISVWMLLNLVLFGIFFRKSEFHLRNFRSILEIRASLNITDKLLLGAVSILVITTGAIAIVAPPNNWDSLSYVMPRIIHWIQNQSVQHYPTHYTSQLYNGPWADFASLHLQILSHGDHFANLLQWMSFVGCLIGVSLIAQRLGAMFREQLLAVIFCATLPSGILHASNSKNTLIIAYWLICFAYYGILLVQTRLNWHLVLAASTSISLAILTKGTAYVYALPFVVWVSWSVVRSLQCQSFPKVFQYCIGAISIFVSLNLGHYLRNIFVFGSPTSTYPYKWGNELFTVSAFASNVIKNISLHIVPPFWEGAWLDLAVIQIHQGLGINPVDPKLNLFLGAYQPTTFTAQGLATFEDTASNSFHFWLIVLALGLAASSTELRKNRHLILYLSMTIASFLLFCLLIKWQIWHSRLHLPIFILSCPAISLILSKKLKSKVIHLLILILLLASVPYVMLNETRPIVSSTNVFNTPRLTQYFAAQPTLQVNYQSLADRLHQKSCLNLGLIQRPDAWEYPLWVMVKHTADRSIRFENVNVDNPSKIAHSSVPSSFEPCAIINIGMPIVPQVIVQGKTYTADPWNPTGSMEPMQIFFPIQLQPVP